MLIIFTGYTASGKTTYEKIMLETYPDFKRLTTITTRPKRKGEVDGKDYYFVNKEDYDNMVEQNYIISPRTYNVVDKGRESTWHYGIGSQEFNEDVRYVTVLDASGILDLIAHVGKKNVKIIYLYADEAELFRRAAFRGDDPKEFLRRLASDKEEFIKIKNLINFSICTSVDEDGQVKNIEKIKKLLEG